MLGGQTQPPAPSSTLPPVQLPSSVLVPVLVPVVVPPVPVLLMTLIASANAASSSLIVTPVLVPVLVPVVFVLDSSTIACTAASVTPYLAATPATVRSPEAILAIISATPAAVTFEGSSVGVSPDVSVLVSAPVLSTLLLTAGFPTRLTPSPPCSTDL